MCIFLQFRMDSEGSLGTSTSSPKVHYKVSSSPENYYYSRLDEKLHVVN